MIDLLLALLSDPSVQEEYFRFIVIITIILMKYTSNKLLEEMEVQLNFF